MHYRYNVKQNFHPLDSVVFPLYSACELDFALKLYSGRSARAGKKGNGDAALRLETGKEQWKLERTGGEGWSSATSSFLF